MCTVSYVPNREGFIFTSNRDEHISRAATDIKTIFTNNIAINYPEDPVGFGSWIAQSSDGRMACLLNGAFVKHDRHPPYAKSRGEILLSCFNYSFNSITEVIDLNNIEPFTLILIDADQRITEMRWDGQKHISHLDNKEVHLWSSCTLYSELLAKEKEKNFKLLINSTSNSDMIHHIHNQMRYEHIVDKPLSDLLKTTSITQVFKTNEDLDMHFKSLVFD